MATRMLIDARHQEETRVAVLKGNRIEEFDFESADKKQIKGNIYLAKVTRVEPSLQAAFVDFGGNRHGFLAFSEIHPDYYQIPKEDREALLAAEAEVAEEEARLRDDEEERGEMPGDEYDADDESAEALAEDLAEDGLEEIDTSEKDHVSTIEEGHVENGDDDDSDDDDGDDNEDDSEDDDDNKGRRSSRGRGRGHLQQSKGRSRAKDVDDARARRLELRRRYKIQDVIQRRQVLLVQVVKEERGNKGAALTSHLSLAGRYTVLMPNSGHGGGISRKISNAGDRKRLKQIVGDLSLPKSMGLIVRTAGLSRTKTEIKRDFDYLARLWDEIRERTLSSAAPALIHSDSDLIKRAIRDIYNREIEEVVVEGAPGYKSAKEFMKLLMPSHARRVKQYVDPVPLFQRFGAEDQLKAMYDPVVQLKSGGYLVINPTEALVSIDINSGRSTKELGIEQTAVATNLEAAREIARQLRLRDMAGLVVIDFIDMDRSGNTRKVEKAMKDALKNDRARIQVGRISSFGLMEMSRQRLRTGVLEATTRECPHCDGTGLVRTASSAGLSALRLIEEEAAKGKGTKIVLSASTEAAVYMLNEKRADLMEIEQRYGVSVEVRPEGEEEGAKMAVASAGPKPTHAPKFEPMVEEVDDYDDDDDDVDDAAEDSDRGTSNADNDDDDSRDRKKRRRRRGGRGRTRSRDGDDDNRSDDRTDNGRGAKTSDDGDKSSDDSDDASETRSDDENGEDRPKKRRRRGGRRRGGRGRGEQRDDVSADDAAQLSEVSEQVSADMAVVAGPDDAPETAEVMAQEDAPKPKKRAPRSRKKPADADAAPETGDKPAAAEEAAAEPAPKPKRTRRKKVDAPAADAVEAPADKADTPAEKPKRVRKKAQPKQQAAEPEAQGAPTETAAPAPTKAAKPKAPAAKSEQPEAEQPATEAGKQRRGWWQRTFGE
ncbi:Rne/Rng family ribonuclease [Qipengyuania marisflavi]|uniref:Ribonuclease E n=1 Tax=Qipengyuania marisflavi TaxID=2486356 RepID=A0A5S3P926_9SPHN|nr:ribonuclease E/G [Qipengyuania marisflavi]TMM50012.1 Rne/Rng family ribonuclease [Qipengyuania marisflavi]